MSLERLRPVRVATTRMVLSRSYGHFDMRFRLIHIAFGVVVFGSAILVSTWLLEMGLHQVQVPDLHDQVVKAELSGKKFNIPVRYFYGESVEKRGGWQRPKEDRVKVDYIHVSVLLPDLRPFYSQDRKRWNALGHGDKLQATLRKSRGGDWFESLANRTASRVKKGLSVKLPYKYGLRAYQTQTGLLYVSKDSDHKVIIRCDYPESVPSPSCDVKSGYTGWNDHVLEYYFSANYLPRWRQINSELIELFQEFQSE